MLAVFGLKIGYLMHEREIIAGIVGIAISLYFVLKYIFYLLVIVDKDAGIREAFKRSGQITKALQSLDKVADYLVTAMLGIDTYRWRSASVA